MKRYLLIALAVVASLAGCGDKHGMEARQYVHKAQESLVAQGVCKDAQDCTSRSVVLFDGAAPWGEQPYVNLYGISNPHIVENVVFALREERKKFGPGVIVTAYSSNHGQPKQELKRIEIE
ncbi:MAG TPA: hypothetical protein VF050_05765 [Moraxellaceae bacterium]